MSRGGLGNNKYISISTAVAAGSVDENTGGIDTLNGGNKARKVTFILFFGAITAAGVQGLKLQQSDDDGSGDSYGDVLGSAVAVADDDDDKMAVLEVINPGKRWVRCVVTRATQNSVIEAGVAILGDLEIKGIADDASVAASGRTVAAIEGTP